MKTKTTRTRGHLRRHSMTRSAATTTIHSTSVLSMRGGRPNETRLSCGAELECSQTEFYITAGRTFTGLIEEGRRQLQAHVRLRTTSHSSGPIPSGSTGSTHRPCRCTATVTPDGLLLGAHQPRRAPRTTGLSLGSRLRIEPNRPDECRQRH